MHAIQLTHGRLHRLRKLVEVERAVGDEADRD